MVTLKYPKVIALAAASFLLSTSLLADKDHSSKWDTNPFRGKEKRAHKLKELMQQPVADQVDVLAKRILSMSVVASVEAEESNTSLLAEMPNPQNMWSALAKIKMMTPEEVAQLTGKETTKAKQIKVGNIATYVRHNASAYYRNFPSQGATLQESNDAFLAEVKRELSSLLSSPAMSSYEGLVNRKEMKARKQMEREANMMTQMNKLVLRGIWGGTEKKVNKQLKDIPVIDPSKL